MRILAGAVLVAVAAVPASAQSTYPAVVLNGRLQTQAYTYSAENPGASSNFFIRRARIQVDLDVSDRVSLVIQPSFEGGRPGGVRLRDAFVDLRLSRPGAGTAVFLRTGAEKVPFGRYELTSSNNLPSIDRNAGRGLAATASNNLFEGGGFIQTDLGASLRLVQPLGDGRSFMLKGGVYNGEGESLSDVNGAKSFGFRASADLTRKLGVGLAWYSHDGIVDVSETVTDSGFRNQGVGLEAQWGKPGDRGLFAVVDYMAGEDGSADRRKLRGLSAVTAYHHRLRAGGTFYAIEPAARFDWADPDAETARNGSTLLAAGVNLYLTSRAQIRLMLERQDPQAPGAPTLTGIRGAMTINFETAPIRPTATRSPDTRD
ncbi:MAG: porin [Gemmatimonadales bacterium]